MFCVFCFVQPSPQVSEFFTIKETLHPLSATFYHMIVLLGQSCSVDWTWGKPREKSARILFLVRGTLCMPLMDILHPGIEIGQKWCVGVEIIICVWDRLRLNCLSSIKVKKVSRNSQVELYDTDLEVWVWGHGTFRPGDQELSICRTYLKPERRHTRSRREHMERRVVVQIEG